MKFSNGNKHTFLPELKKRVDAHLAGKPNGGYADTSLWLKGLFLMLLYLVSYAVVFLPGLPLAAKATAYAAMGLTGVMLVFNLVHDASHNALSGRRWINRSVTGLGDLLGINMHIWNIRHNIQHHTFTNALGGDLIIENIPLIRLSPHQPFKSFHRYQVYYAPLLYLCYSFYWMFVIDFKLFLMKDICNLHNIKHPLREWVILFLSKLFYVGYVVLAPWWLTPLSFGEVMICFVAMHAAAGLLLSTIALLGHFVEGPVFPDTANGLIDNSWSEHELDATIDFAPRSRLVHAITGGLNTHVAHHLFPTICHTHYFSVTKIIEAFCVERNLPYKKESFVGGMCSHVRHLRTLSKPGPEEAGVASVIPELELETTR